MLKKIKKLLTILLAGGIIASTPTTVILPAFADTNEQTSKQAVSNKNSDDTVLHMFYGDDYESLEDFRVALLDEIETGNNSISSYSLSDTASNSKLVWEDAPDDYLEMLDELREAMKNREDSVTVVYHTDEVVKNAKDYLFALAILYDSYVHTGDPAGGDYLYHNMAGTGLDSEVVECADGGSNIYITFDFNWRTTKTEEQVISIAIDSVLNSFNWSDSTSDYEKITDIYDYIITHVTYDYDAAALDTNDGSDLFRSTHTAYSPLIYHTGVCEGVATTFYRMVLTAGIDCRSISGTVTGGSHLWNIVELDDIYYNVDATWDLGAKSISKYRYYLKGSTNFDKTHKRSSSYKTSFDVLYPTSETDYELSIDDDANYSDSDADDLTNDSDNGVLNNITGVNDLITKRVYAPTVKKGSDGVWYYYDSTGAVDLHYTGFASNANGDWYVKNGKVLFDTSDILKDETGAIGEKGAWYYVIDSKVQVDFTGLSNFRNTNGWWYIDHGKVDFDKHGVYKNCNGWYYITDGKVRFDYSGFAENNNGKWYINDGKVVFNTTDILRDNTGELGENGAWYYVIDSKVQTDFTGLSNFRNTAGWWYIKNGKVDFSHNGVDKNKNGWWYVTDGKVQFGFTGLANYKNVNGWWYIQNGRVDFSHNGVDKNKNGWWYVTGGKVQFGFTGLANYRNKNGWWYIKNGKVDFNHNGVDKNKNGWWYVTDGKVQFNFTGLANYSNVNGWWYIVNGKVDFNHNGVDKNKNGWWYVTDGKVNFGYTGVADYKNKNGWWYIKSGKVDFSYNGAASNKNGTWLVENGKVNFSTNETVTVGDLATGNSTYKTQNGRVLEKLGEITFGSRPVSSGASFKSKVSAFRDEANKAMYSYVSDSIFITINNCTYNSGEYYLTHVIVSDPSQIKGAQSNGSYGGTRETASSAAKRTGAILLTNASFFSFDTGKPTTTATIIDNGKILNNVSTSGKEACLKSDGTLYTPQKGLSAQSLVNSGVRYSWSAKPVLIENSKRTKVTDDKTAPRTAVGMVEPCEYYIVTAGTNYYIKGFYYSEMQDIFEALHCSYAVNFDGGGSSTLIFKNNMINEPSRGAERAVADFLCFYE